jgi:hypothetical protein
MSDYSIGIDDHYAWANLVSVTMDGPDEVLLDKRRVDLLDQTLAASPYHHDTLRMRLEAAQRLVRDVTTSANNRAQSALSSLDRRTCAGDVPRHRDPRTSTSPFACYGCRGSRELLGHESRRWYDLPSGPHSSGSPPRLENFLF